MLVSQINPEGVELFRNAKTLFISLNKYGRWPPESIRSITERRYIKIRPKTIDLSLRLRGIHPTNFVVIPWSLVLRLFTLNNNISKIVFYINH